MNHEDIVNLARNFKKYWNTNNPYEIADRLGIVVMHRNSTIKDFTAQTVKMDGYPTIISINDNFTEFSKKVLCAHELGHALLHENYVNHFATTSSNITTNVELEANLFAIALLTDDDINNHINIPIEKMNNYLLKTILDYNISKKEV